MEFKSWPKIERLKKKSMTITQKIHGTNASVWIRHLTDDVYEVRAASRTRFLTPEHDNYGFAAFVEENRQAFIDCLGPGTWFGEWAGPGINTGEGLKEKTFVLFYAPEGAPLPPRCMRVPVLYDGPIDTSKIAIVKHDLLETGSKLVPGYMKPEGVVVHMLGVRVKDVFEDEEDTGWRRKEPGAEKQEKPAVDVSHLLQPLRLEKLLSRDESLKTAWPANFREVLRVYVDDLESETTIDDTTRAAVWKQAPAFLKACIGGAR